MALAPRLLSGIRARRLHLRHRPDLRERTRCVLGGMGGCSCPSARRPTSTSGGKSGIGRLGNMPHGIAARSCTSDRTSVPGARLVLLERTPTPRWLGAGDTTRKFPKCRQPGPLVKWSAGFEHRTMKAPKPKQWAEREVQQLSKLARAGAGVSTSSRAGPSRGIGEANGTSDGDNVEEVAPRLPAADQLDGLKKRSRQHHPACAARKDLPSRVARTLTDIAPASSLASTSD